MPSFCVREGDIERPASCGRRGTPRNLSRNPSRQIAVKTDDGADRRDEVGRNAASKRVPVAANAERTSEGTFDGWFDNEQGNYVDHIGSFLGVVGAGAHDDWRTEGGTW